MDRKWLVLVGLLGAATARAQEPQLSATVGLRAWYTDWTTFGYKNATMTEDSAEPEIAFMPMLSARYGKWLGSLSGLPSTDFEFVDGGGDRTVGSREEFDINVGYFVLPSLAVTLGYKRVSQKDDPYHYQPEGPVLGLTGNAPLEGAWSLYGSLGVGWLKTHSGNVHFDTDYRLADLGLAYTLSGARMPRNWTFTGGYRIQIMTSKDAFNSEDGRDTTNGFTLGVMATF